MIIITDAQYRSCVSMIEALAQSGEDIILCAEEGTDPPAFHSRYCVMARFMPKEKEAYKKELYDLCSFVYAPSSEEKPVIVPIGLKTVNILSEYKEEFSEVADFLVPDKAILDTANDKKLTASAAKAIGIRTPREIAMDSLGKPKDFYIRYPLYVKPVFGEELGLRAHERYEVVFNENELTEAYFKFTSLTGKAPLVQEYAGDTGVGVCVVMDRNSKPVTVFCHRRIREYPVSGGPSSCCISMYNKKLVKKSIELLESIKYTGIAMVEFRGDEDYGFSLLEINTRIWGSFPLCIKSGSSFIQDYVLASRGASFSKPDAYYKRGKVMSFALNDILAGADYIRSGDTALGLHAFLAIADPTVSDGIFDINDPKPFFVYLRNCAEKFCAQKRREYAESKDEIRF